METRIAFESSTVIQYGGKTKFWMKFLKDRGIPHTMGLPVHLLLILEQI